MKNLTANSLFTVDGASWTNEKLKLMIFPSLWFFKTRACKDWNNLKEPKYFFLQMC